MIIHLGTGVIIEMAHVYIHLSIIAVLLVLLTPTLAHASNESSYRYGVHLAINNLTNQIVPPWDVDEDNPSSPRYNFVGHAHYSSCPYVRLCKQVD